ncbi:MAG: XRE family transcriptional regulator [Pleomorphochaeta sp.]
MKNKIIRTPIQLGPLLKEIRFENSFTQVQLYEESYVLPKTISALENGNIKCTLESFFDYINACGYHMELVSNNIDKDNEEVD